MAVCLVAKALWAVVTAAVATVSAASAPACWAGTLAQIPGISGAAWAGAANAMVKAEAARVAEPRPAAMNLRHCDFLSQGFLLRWNSELLQLLTEHGSDFFCSESPWLTAVIDRLLQLAGDAHQHLRAGLPRRW